MSHYPPDPEWPRLSVSRKCNYCRSLQRRLREERFACHVLQWHKMERYHPRLHRYSGKRLLRTNLQKFACSNIIVRYIIAEKPKVDLRPIMTKSKITDAIFLKPDTNSGINCTFDDGGTCGWIQESASVYRWTVQNVSPNSTSTIGPLHDVTSGSPSQPGRKSICKTTTVVIS